LSKKKFGERQLLRAEPRYDFTAVPPLGRR